MADPARSLREHGTSRRLSIALLVGVLAWIGWRGTPWRIGAVSQLLVAWDVAGITLLALVAHVIVGTSSEDTRCRAAAYDPGRTAVWLIVCGLSMVSLFSTMYVMRSSADLPKVERALALVAAMTTVAVSWLLTHAAFTLRYAHLYYRDDAEGVGGLEMPSCNDPDDLDFAYFAFTIGMCFQVSDVQVSSRQIRRTVLFHALISFAYNTFILALAVNLAIGQMN